VKPQYVPGDQVAVIPVHMTGSWLVPALVLSVQQSNEIPDVKARGLGDWQPWSYWVLTFQNNCCGTRIMGPLSSTEVQNISAWEDQSNERAERHARLAAR